MLIDPRLQQLAIATDPSLWNVIELYWRQLATSSLLIPVSQVVSWFLLLSILTLSVIDSSSCIRIDYAWQSALYSVVLCVCRPRSMIDQHYHHERLGD